MEGIIVGSKVDGDFDGSMVIDFDGVSDGDSVGDSEGRFDGLFVGFGVGGRVGEDVVGLSVGFGVGDCVNPVRDAHVKSTPSELCSNVVLMT